jgi:hypothetical protein
MYGIAISGKRFADKDFEERIRAVVLAAREKNA